MKNYKLIIGIALLTLAVSTSCRKFLDVVPDNVATIDNAFTMRSQAEKYLFTCYSYMPRNGNLALDPAMLGGDEVWEPDDAGGAFKNIAKGVQNTVNPYGDNWATYYMALRDCNIFLENIGRVPDLRETERRRWISEVKFLKAYYHFILIRMYGPIPLIKENLPVDADVNQVKVPRNPVDECFSYVTQLLDEAIPSLPPTIDNPTKEDGRITQLIALSLKAKILVTAASPLFNGNDDQKSLHNNDGTALFSAEVSKAKWDSAAVACKRAVEMAEAQGMKLYYYQPAFQQFPLSDTITTEMSIRNAVTEKWNSEIIWANTQVNTAATQALFIPFLDPLYQDQLSTRGYYSPTLKIAEMFYSKNGVPISEDKTYDYNGRYNLRTATDKDKKYIRNGSIAARLSFDREPRYYADLGFDRGIWYGQGKYDDKKDMDLFYIASKFKEIQGAGKVAFGTITGFYLKKLVHFQGVINANGFSATAYAWPEIRLSDLYLLYAEALNESEGPTEDAMRYVDLVRRRAGLKTIRESWSQFSNNPAKFSSLAGLRSIIHQERLIELCFEGQRFWDLRRWKEAATELNKPIAGWDVSQTTADGFYKPKNIFNQTFGVKDYFWPIREANITVNRNLVQNIGW